MTLPDRTSVELTAAPSAKSTPSNPQLHTIHTEAAMDIPIIPEPLPAYIAEDLPGKVVLRVLDPQGISMDDGLGNYWSYRCGDLFAVEPGVAQRMVDAGVVRYARIEGVEVPR